jgi:hypothetical protein
MAKKAWRKTTPEERMRWRANHERLERVLARRLARERVTREQAISGLRGAK